MVENLCKAIWLLRVASFLANSKPMCFQGLKLLDCVLWWYHVKMFIRWRWIDGDCSWPPGWGEWDRSNESNSFSNSCSENTSGTSLFSRPRWVEVYNRGGCTLKHCWEKISDPSMERLRMDDERSLVSVWVFLWIFCPPTMILGLSLIKPSVRVKMRIIPCWGYSWGLLTICNKGFFIIQKAWVKNLKILFESDQCRNCSAEAKLLQHVFSIN